MLCEQADERRDERRLTLALTLTRTRTLTLTRTRTLTLTLTFWACRSLVEDACWPVLSREPG